MKKRTRGASSKAATAKDYKAIINIQEKIIKAYSKTNNANIKAFKLTYNYYTYMQLLYDAHDLQKTILEQQQELEDAYKDRNEAIRRYDALAQLGEMAKNYGVDLKAKLPEHEKNKWKDFKFNINTKVLESGKTAFTATLTAPKKKDKK